MKYQTLRQVKNNFVSKLTKIYEEREAESIAHLVLEHILNESYGNLICKQQLPVEDETIKIIESYLTELLEGKPVQHLLGYAYFRDLKLWVDQTVLIPRNETEFLEEKIIELSKSYPDRSFTGLDLGTGSGCIPLSLETEVNNIEMDAVDYSEHALETARKNAMNYGTETIFIVDDILNPSFQKYRTDGYDFIVSNPPYIPDSERSFMHRNVLDYEPRNALFVSDEDPMKYYKAILKIANNLLKTNGKLFFEIHEQKGQDVYDLLYKQGYENIELIHDLAGKDRICTCTKKL